MTLASGRNKVKYILGLWLLQTQASLEGGYSFSLLPFQQIPISLNWSRLAPVVTSALDHS